MSLVIGIYSYFRHLVHGACFPALLHYGFKELYGHAHSPSENRLAMSDGSGKGKEQWSNYGGA